MALLSFTLDLHFPFQFLSGEERKVQWQAPLLRNPMEYTTAQAGRTLGGGGGWAAGAGGDGKAQQLLRMNETISHGPAKLHEVPVYPC